MLPFGMPARTSVRTLRFFTVSRLRVSFLFGELLQSFMSAAFCTLDARRGERDSG